MKKYKFGNCIPEAIKIYNRLKRQGNNPIFVEGWVEVNYNDLDIEREFLELYYPEILKQTENNLEFDDYIRVIPHTWITCDGKIIDKTINQFDIFGGVIRYYEKMRYIPKIKINADDIMNWFDDRDYIIKRNRFIRYPEKN